VTAPPRYRVWCVSWEDDEEHGSDVVGYDTLNHDRSTQDRGVVYIPIYSLGAAADAAEAYADYAHDNRDGYESTWPLVFRVRCPDGSVQDFEVHRDFVAEFSAAPAKAAACTHVLWGGRVLCEDPRLRGVPRDWPPDQRWISLKDVADGTAAPPDRCEACWARAPALVEGIRQIGSDS
jgi:hypothetical protein